MKAIHVVLSGGGARAVAHLGVLQYLNENKIEVKAISACSAGAIFGAFFAAGYSPEEILQIAKSSKLFGFSNFLIGKPGFFDMKPFETVFHEHFPKNKLEELNIPLTVVATDIVKGEIRYFQSGDLAQCLMASSCVPLIFQPVEYEGNIYLDGGILNNFPIEPFLNKEGFILGVHVNSLSKNIEEIHMKDLLDRSFHFALNAQVGLKSGKCNYFLEPPNMSRFGLFDLSATDAIFDVSYQYAKAQGDALLEAINAH